MRGWARNSVPSSGQAREVFEQADDALGEHLSRLCHEGPEDQLRLTANTQPAILTTSIAALRVLQAETGLKPDFVAGHSLGEYSALVSSWGARFCRCGTNCAQTRNLYAGSCS